MSDIKVSVIIPVFNLEKYLDRCLHSVINQSLQEIEIICINDASTDNSQAILEKFAHKDHRIKTFVTGKIGQGQGRNLGIQNARGEYIGFVDGDDYVHRDMFLALYTAAKQRDSCMAFCHAHIQDDAGRAVKYPYYDAEQKHFRSHDVVTTFTNEEIVPKLSFITVVCWNKIYKRTLLLQNNIQFGDGIIHEDIPFFYEAILNSRKIRLVRKQLYYYTASRTGSTTRAVMSMSPRLLEVLQLTKERIKDKLVDKEVEKQFNLFRTTQLLSFINYAFYRPELPKFIKRRFFLLVRKELEDVTPTVVSALSWMDRLQLWFIRRKYYQALRAKTLIDAALFQAKTAKGLFRLLLQLPAGLYYHSRYYAITFFARRKYKKTKAFEKNSM